MSQHIRDDTFLGDCFDFSLVTEFVGPWSRTFIIFENIEVHLPTSTYLKYLPTY